MSPLILFPAIERYAVDMLIKADECIAQFGLLGISFVVELNQGMADEPTQPGGGACIDKRAPDHITGNCEAAPTQMEPDLVREHPQNPDEAPEKKRRLQEPNPEIGRQLGQMASILVHSLVRVGTHFACIAKAKSALGPEPL